MRFNRLPDDGDVPKNLMQQPEQHRTEPVYFTKFYRGSQAVPMLPFHGLQDDVDRHRSSKRRGRTEQAKAGFIQKPDGARPLALT